MIPTGIDSPEENLKRLLARFSPPQAGPSAQPMTGAPPPVSPGISSPATAVTPVGPKIPSAAAQRQPADEAELRRLTDPTQESHYSGVDQYRHKHPILGTIAKIGDVALGAMFPGVAQMVPGTQLHHQGLVNQQESRVAEDVGQQAKEATTANTAATTAHTQAETDALGEPKVGTTPEETTIHDLMTGQNGQPRINPTTNQPYTYFDAYTKVMQAKQDVKPDRAEPKPDSIDQQYQDAIASGDHKKAQQILQVKADLAKAGQAPQRPPQITMVVPGANGQQTVQTIRPGQAVPSGAMSPTQFGGQNQMTAATKTMIESAPGVLSLSARVRSLVEQQQKSLGPAASRWSEFMAGTVGAPNPEFTKLRTDVGLLTTKLMRMHVGARGGTEIMAHFQNLIDSGKQDPKNLIAALDEIDRYAKDTAAEKPGSAPAPAGGGEEVIEYERGSDGKLHPKKQ